MMGSHLLHWVKLPDKGDGGVTPTIMLPYVRLYYSRLERDAPAEFEEVEVITESHVESKDGL